MKDITKNHRSDALQWYESIHTHGNTRRVLIPPSPTISKVNPMGDDRKRQFLYYEIMSKMIYMSKLIAKILNAKTILGPECYSFNYIARATINNVYTVCAVSYYISEKINIFP